MTMKTELKRRFEKELDAGNACQLYPTRYQNQKSFYNKAWVTWDEDNNEILISYGVPVLRKNIDGTLSRLWSGWSATTGRHIAAFAGINKAEWDKMKVQHA